jgi:hypothetical protein
LWVSLSNAQATAADKAAGAATTALSADTRLIIERQAVLAVESFRGWALGLAIVGAVLLAIGGIWRLASGRAPEPLPTGGGYGGQPGTGYPPAQPGYGHPPQQAPGGYPQAGGWDDSPANPPWSSRPY